MSIYSILLIIFCILFFIIFFYVLFTNNNKLIKYRVTKDPILDETGINYNNIKKKYSQIKCTDMCDKKFCNEYQTQLIKYDLCKECKKENKCYDPYEGDCLPCKNNYSCEQLYGCKNKPPISPVKNFCTRCWNL